MLEIILLCVSELVAGSIGAAAVHIWYTRKLDMSPNLKAVVVEVLKLRDQGKIDNDIATKIALAARAERRAK